VLVTTWGGAAAATWNRHRAAVRSFAAWLDRPDLAEGLERRDPDRAPAPSRGAPAPRACSTSCSTGAPAADRCPDTGRTRLSYERAEYLFTRATGRDATLRLLRPRG
jgi:hypothetical protein